METDITKASRGDDHAVRTPGQKTARDKPDTVPAINRTGCPKSPECAAVEFFNFLKACEPE